MKLITLQFNFARLLGQFLTWCFEHGYNVTLGECWRPPETALIYQKQGKGIARSLHCERLAVDLNLIINDKLAQNVEDYRPMGAYWEGLSTKDFQCCWGGNFAGKTQGDACHFSISYGGRK